MITFILFFLTLMAGYIFYGRFIEKVFGADSRPTPAVTNPDGVDFIPMPTWKIYLIQLLNIAGTGPIFGALSGALFGPVVYLWIVLGGVFAGAVHDYMAGMISLRHNGMSLLEIHGKYLGKATQSIVGVGMIILLVMVGSLFSRSPAELLGMITPARFDMTFWMIVIVIYYFVATFLPVDKIIGRIYPLFGICLIVMAVGISYSILFSGKVYMPELWDNFGNMHPQKIPVYPFMFITVACGALSGFHATQSPIMARCCKSEKECRGIFYGAMVTESLIALVWAAAGISYYEDAQTLLAAGGGCSAVVYHICQTALGKAGCILAMLGVVFCPISSGDTAYRALRLIISDRFGIDQRNWKKRLYITIPIIATGTLLCFVEFSILWRYFAWVNQILGTITLWAITVYLKQEKRNYFVTLIPALFMTAIVSGYAVMQFF